MDHLIFIFNNCGDMFSYNCEKIHFKTFDQIDRVTGRNSNSNSNTLELLVHSFSLWLFLLEPLPV